MSILSLKGDKIVGQCQTLLVYTGVRPAVHHQCHINIPKVSQLPHRHFRAAGLLRRSPVHHQLEGFLKPSLLQGDGGGADTGALHVVAAAVAQAPQRVVLTQQADPGPALSLAPGGPEGGGPAL